MTDTEYLDAQRRLMIVGGILEDLDLDGFLDRIRTAESVAPVLDPTLYRLGADRLQRIQALGVACREVQRAYRSLREIGAAREPVRV